MDYSNLNLSIRATTKLCGLDLPLLIKISDISISREKTIDCTVSFSGEDVIHDKTTSPFHNEYEYFLLQNRLKDIWKAINYDVATNSNTIISIMNVSSFDKFEELCLHTDLCSTVDIIRILNEISYYEEKLKKAFINECIVAFDLKREFPKVQLKDDNMSGYIGKFSEYFSYPDIMYDLQLVSEFPMSTWFPENKDKTFIEWSWREIECKKIYLAMKNNTENFRELVKAKALEISRESK